MTADVNWVIGMPCVGKTTQLSRLPLARFNYINTDQLRQAYMAQTDIAAALAQDTLVGKLAEQSSDSARLFLLDSATAFLRYHATLSAWLMPILDGWLPLQKQPTIVEMSPITFSFAPRLGRVILATVDGNEHVSRICSKTRRRLPDSWRVKRFYDGAFAYVQPDLRVDDVVNLKEMNALGAVLCD
jgi:hypothetical protein